MIFYEHILIFRLHFFRMVTEKCNQNIDFFLAYRLVINLPVNETRASRGVL